MKKITIQVPNKNKKNINCSHYNFTNFKTIHHSLFLAIIQKLGIALKFVKQEMINLELQQDQQRMHTLWNGYMRTKDLVNNIVKKRQLSESIVNIFFH